MFKRSNNCGNKSEQKEIADSRRFLERNLNVISMRETFQCVKSL